MHQNASLFSMSFPWSQIVMFKTIRTRPTSEVGLGDPEYDAQDESYEARDGNYSVLGMFGNVWECLVCSCMVDEYQTGTW